MFEELFAQFRKHVDLQSLQYLAAVRMATSVCESEDVQCMIGRFRKINCRDEYVGILDGQWEQLHDKVTRNLTQIGVSKIIIDIILENLWPISFEVYKWILYHFEDRPIDYISKFCWTPQIKIDYEKTAKIMIQDETRDIRKRFEVACFYCLDSEVRFLWEQMNLSERRSFFVRGNLKKSSQNPITIYWSYYIQELPIDYWNNEALNYLHLFKYAVENGNLSATKFFLGKLEEPLRHGMCVISNCINSIHNFREPNWIMKDYLAIACFLICQLPSDDRVFNYVVNFSSVFHYFLEWPRQTHFLTVVNRLRFHLKQEIFRDLLETIFEKIEMSFKDHDYKKLFMEFWNQSPVNDKAYVNTDSRVGYDILIRYVEKHFRFVFKQNSFDIKSKFRAIVLQHEVLENETHFEKENVEFFKFLVRERVTTKSSIVKFSIGTQLNWSLEELMHLMDSILEIV